MDINQFTSKQIYLTIAWAGVIIECLFVLGAFISGAFSLDGFARNSFVSFFAPITLMLGLLSMFQIGWWLANRHAGVACYREVACITYCHVAFVFLLFAGCFYVITSGNIEYFLYYATAIPIVGESMVLVGLLVHRTRELRTSHTGLHRAHESSLPAV